MKRNSLIVKTGKMILPLLFILLTHMVKAQIPVGQVAPDFTVTDMNGNTHNLYTYLNQGKYVMLKIGWFGCGTCDMARPGWNNMYHNLGCNQKDVILLEFDINNDDAFCSNPAAIKALFTSLGNPLDGSAAMLDSTYLLPQVPFITTDGGANTVDLLYGFTEYTSEIIIEPSNKTILGASYDHTLINGTYFDNSNWAYSFAGLISEGMADLPGNLLTETFEVELPNVYHAVPSAFQVQHITSTPGLMPPITQFPYAAFCGALATNCDTMRPEFTNYTVSAFNDTARSVQVNWVNANPTLCNQYVVFYKIAGQLDTLHSVIANGNSAMVTNLIPGDYDFYIKCACNQGYNYDYTRVKVKSDTSFVNTECGATCNYRLVVYEDLINTIAMPFGSWTNSNSKLEISVGAQKEFYLIGSNDYKDTVNGNLTKAQSFNLKFCKGDSIGFKFFEPGIGSGALRIGFKMYDENNVIIKEYFSDTTFAANFPGYTEFPKMASNCGPSQPEGIHQVSSNAMAFQIVPNPNQGNFTIQLVQTKNQKLNFTVLDIYGRVIIQNNTTTNELNGSSIHLAEISSGMYLARIVDEKGQVSQLKFTIE